MVAVDDPIYGQSDVTLSTFLTMYQGSGTWTHSYKVKPNRIRLLTATVPAGAAVTGPDGEALGKTPLKIEWPVSDLPVTFELRLGGYKRKLKQTVVNGNTALRVELERAPVVRRAGAPSSGGTGSAGSARSDRAGSAADGLMRP